jgi:hypothetical protein
MQSFICILWNKRRRKSKGQIKNGQPRKTCNNGHTRHRTKTNNTKVQHRKPKIWAIRTPPNPGASPGVRDGQLVPASYKTPSCYSHSQYMLPRHEPYYKQLEVKTNQTSFVCEYRSWHHNTELRTEGHIIGPHKQFLSFQLVLKTLSTKITN